MERLVIIDHDNHQLFIEDVSLEEIEKAGGEQEYIEQNYEVAINKGNYSWDYITDITYFPDDEDKEPIEVNIPSWKPSEEQLNSLDEVYKTHGANSACRRVIFNLLNDLKKLL